MEFAFAGAACSVYEEVCVFMPLPTKLLLSQAKEEETREQSAVDFVNLRNKMKILVEYCLVRKELEYLQTIEQFRDWFL